MLVPHDTIRNCAGLEHYEAESTRLPVSSIADEGLLDCAIIFKVCPQLDVVGVPTLQNGFPIELAASNI